MKNKIYLVVGTLALFFAGFLIGVKVYKDREKERLSFLTQKDFSTFVRTHSPKKGPEKPSVYLTEFLDPECESCRSFHSVVDKILLEYPDKIQLVVRYAPFHGNSLFAIKILEAARKQNKYWETLDLLFRKQPEWGGHHHPRPELIWDYLPELGLNIDEIKKDLNDISTDEKINQDKADGETLAVRGTPTFFVNGKAVELSYQDLKNAIEAEL